MFILDGYDELLVKLRTIALHDHIRGCSQNVKLVLYTV